jgi:hypothetical protein
MNVGMTILFASYGWDDCPDDRVQKKRSSFRGGMPNRLGLKLSGF